MNEQLIVKNFGPIKDATVDFKRVTVFIGPTGGGKSTLAKLAAILNQGEAIGFESNDINTSLSDFGIKNYLIPGKSFLKWNLGNGLGFHIDTTKRSQKRKSTEVNKALARSYEKIYVPQESEWPAEVEKFLSEPEYASLHPKIIKNIRDNYHSIIKSSIEKSLTSILFPKTPNYIPTERILLSSLEDSWAGIIRDDINLPRLLVKFANSFSTARKNVKRISIPFLNIEYLFRGRRNLIKSNTSARTLNLSEAASGIQSVTPLLIVLEYLIRNTEQVQSFIIEEPELNLYPTTQQGLLNWLVEKCTKGENDLTITTHSPYLLAHFNTLLFAYQVAQNYPERAEEIAKIVPRESWLNPAEFAAYHVEGQQENGVRSIVNPETGLISYNGLDAIASAEAGEFEKLLDINAGLAVEW